MKSHKTSTWFPLLEKELTELANRRRTYVLRTVYAGILFSGGLLILYGDGGLSTDASSRLGQGMGMFSRIVWLQFVGICLFMPAMAASTLTSEKERDTLTLLLLTPIKPWAILLQKLLSRVIPMLCLVILSFPLMAVAYSCGGVSMEMLQGASVTLLLFVLMVASIGLMCSAFFRTTVESFLATYLLLTLAVFVMSTALAQGFFSSTWVLMLFLTVCSLLMARVCLESRAFVPPRNVLLQIFQALDAQFNEMNAVTGGVILVRDGSPYPVDRPVAWRETTKKSLGTFRYLFRMLVVLEVPILFVAQEINLNVIQSDAATTWLLYLLWCISAALVCVHAASVISAERSRQTLESLLTTPISGRDLILQKMSGVNRLTNVLLVPFLTIFLLHHWLRDMYQDLTYLLLSAFSAIVLLRLTAWMAMWMGLVVRSQMRAVFSTLGCIALLLAGPQLIQVLATAAGIPIPNWLESSFTVSPSFLIHQLEKWYALAKSQSPAAAQQHAVVIAGILMGYALIYWMIRRHCLNQADQLLGRVSRL
ncbi:ABC transporter permease [Planctomicrobium piriforme]|uniref:ABC-2 family transporter protein n=1 Tax=Planctomicrobium piriforme TaxID=1576369 RepID=A0A1I3E179_9PLAN|nr:ABC transporter permease subunit [Planctomicrobium piriforme]SFH92750.1 ABC-2 family transporter protein [Planctomicrobium piriforme]